MTREIFAVVLHFRTPEKTLTCLKSLLRESIQRCVLVDNSEDGGRSLESMRAGLDHFRELGMNILVEEPGRNLGFAAGVNLAMELICKQGSFDVLLLNSDARLLPGAADALSSAIGRGLAVAVPKTRDGETFDKSMPVIYYNRWFGILSSHPLPGSFLFASGACMLISADEASVCYWDEDFFFYGEDVVFCHALHEKGKKFQMVESAEIMHEGSGSSRSGSLFYEYHINRCHLLLAKKLAENRFDLVGMSMGRALWLPCRAVVRSVRFRSVVPLKGLGMAACDTLSGRRRSLTPPPSA